MFDDFDAQGYTINYEKVLESDDMSSVTKLLALKLMKTPYMSVGDFLQSLSDSDVESMVQMLEAKEKRLDDILIISEMLATAEGLDGAADLDVFIDRSNQLTGFIIIESLKRKGLVKVYYENMSFGEDLGDKVVVERI